MASTDLQVENDLLTGVRNILKILCKGESFENHFKEVIVKAATPGHVICEIKILPEHINKAGSVYGGFICCLVDFGTTAACWSTDKRKAGVSINLNTNFVGAAKLNDVLTMDCKCSRIGSTLAFTEMTITNQDGKLISTSSHTKLVNGPH